MVKKIVRNPKIMLGKPCFEGTRIPIYLVLELLAAGATPEEIIKDHYPTLTKDDVLEAVKYAAEFTEKTPVGLKKLLQEQTT
jgi:uncharacterized protein (DUF433 family)